MSALSLALDKQLQDIQLGENMNPEYCWSNKMEELIIQFYFQLTRTSDIKNLEDKYTILLTKIFNTGDIKIDYIKIIYKLIGHTRDIISGKGEYNLTYMLISNLYKFSQTTNCPEKYKLKIQTMATSSIESLIRTEINEHPYGSWKDMKYFCNYHISEEYRFEYKLKELNDPLFNKVIDLIIGQLQCDEHAPVKTLVARWIPREKSDKFGWITQILATRYYSEWTQNTNPNHSLTDNQKTASRRKCLTHFRQLVSKINKTLNTPQINQCNGTWAKIDFDKDVTSITLRKQSNAFDGVYKRKDMRSKVINNADRLKCRENYHTYVENCKTGKSVAKGKRVSIIDFVKDAINTNTSDVDKIYTIDKDVINAQWKDNSTQNNNLERCIPMVDTSASMETDNNVPLYSAIGLGIRIAEKSKFGKRVLTFSSSPSWINLDDCLDFTSMVNKVRQAPWGSNTNFRAALDLILNTAIQNNINPIDMNNTTLIILSDMQIDCAEGHSFNSQQKNQETMFKMMKQKYHDAGMRTIYNQPYELPHIVFWNLRATTGFPSLCTEKNTSMMSGNNPGLLNAFSNKGVAALKEVTPWNSLIEQLSNKRYNYLDKIVDNLWNWD